jgi:hypothetical protein
MVVVGAAANQDEAALAAHAAVLADGIEAALPTWVRRSVERLLVAWTGSADAAALAAAEEAGMRARSELMPRLRALLSSDVDAQLQSPLSLLRTAVRYPTDVLRAAGVPPVERDEFAERAFPEDVYDLAPAAFADLDPELAEPGLVWGAAKAHVVLARRRAPR